MEENRRSERGDRSPSEECHLLTFALCDGEYAVDLRYVQEVKCWSAITPIPNAPPHIKGVMNLRGTIIPIIDLRTRFAMPETEYTRFTVIIMVKADTKVQGLAVDAVSDVLSLGGIDVHPPPELGGVEARFIAGVVQHEEKLVTVLDVTAVLSDEGTRAASAQQ
jgi:purine-binding chemotaxis protein CheW